MENSDLICPILFDCTQARLTPTSCYTPFGIIDLLSPKDKDVRWELIAQALSRIPRFNGLTGDFGVYSVAQHCVLGADVMYEEKGDLKLALRFLLHDAHEAFLGDISVPVQNCFGVDFYRKLDNLKNKWDEIIYSAVELTPPSISEQTHLVLEIHNLIFAYECRRFFSDHIKLRPDISNDNNTMTEVIIQQGLETTWNAEKAETLFIDRIVKYLGITHAKCKYEYLPLSVKTS